MSATAVMETSKPFLTTHGFSVSAPKPLVSLAAPPGDAPYGDAHPTTHAAAAAPPAGNNGGVPSVAADTTHPPSNNHPNNNTHSIHTTTTKQQPHPGNNKNSNNSAQPGAQQSYGPIAASAVATPIATNTNALPSITPIPLSIATAAKPQQPPAAVTVTRQPSQPLPPTTPSVPTPTTSFGGAAAATSPNGAATANQHQHQHRVASPSAVRLSSPMSSSFASAMAQRAANAGMQPTLQLPHPGSDQWLKLPTPPGHAHSMQQVMSPTTEAGWKGLLEISRTSGASGVLGCRVAVDEEAGRDTKIEICCTAHTRPAVRRLVKSVIRGLKACQEPERAQEGMGGTYFFSNENGRKVAILKPCDEEPLAPNNPKGYVGRSLGEPGWKPTVRVGEAAMREVAAYLLDRDNWAHVPTSVLVRARHPIFCYQSRMSSVRESCLDLAAAQHAPQGKSGGGTLPMKLGSLQEFVQHMCDTSEMGPSRFSASDVHRIGILDIRLFNTDRHAGNMLVRAMRPAGGSGASSGGAPPPGSSAALRQSQLGEPQYELIPIDHGFCLPETLEACYFEWLHWPQAMLPFTEEELAYIRSIDVEKDKEMLREELPNLRPECLRVMEIATTLLKRGAEAGLTLHDIAMVMTRPFEGGVEEPSELERTAAAAKAALEEELAEEAQALEGSGVEEEDEEEDELEMDEEDEEEDDGVIDEADEEGEDAPTEADHQEALHHEQEHDDLQPHLPAAAAALVVPSLPALAAPTAAAMAMASSAPSAAASAMAAAAAAAAAAGVPVSRMAISAASIGATAAVGVSVASTAPAPASALAAAAANGMLHGAGRVRTRLASAAPPLPLQLRAVGAAAQPLGPGSNTSAGTGALKQMSSRGEDSSMLFDFDEDQLMALAQQGGAHGGGTTPTTPQPVARSPGGVPSLGSSLSSGDGLGFSFGLTASLLASSGTPVASRSALQMYAAAAAAAAGAVSSSSGNANNAGGASSGNGNGSSEESSGGDAGAAGLATAPRGVVGAGVSGGGGGLVMASSVHVSGGGFLWRRMSKDKARSAAKHRAGAGAGSGTPATTGKVRAEGRGSTSGTAGRCGSFKPSPHLHRHMAVGGVSGGAVGGGRAAGKARYPPPVMAFSPESLNCLFKDMDEALWSRFMGAWCVELEAALRSGRWRQGLAGNATIAQSCPRF